MWFKSLFQLGFYLFLIFISGNIFYAKDNRSAEEVFHLIRSFYIDNHLGIFKARVLETDLKEELAIKDLEKTPIFVRFNQYVGLEFLNQSSKGMIKLKPFEFVGNYLSAFLIDEDFEKFSQNYFLEKIDGGHWLFHFLKNVEDHNVFLEISKEGKITRIKVVYKNPEDFNKNVNIDVFYQKDKDSSYEIIHRISLHTTTKDRYIILGKYLYDKVYAPR